MSALTSSSRLSRSGGFTLIELVIIIVVLGILAAVAIPKYQDLSGQAKESAARASLGAIRSGVAIYYANTAVTTGTATWPTVSQLETFGTVLSTAIPKNPYQTNAGDSVVTGVTRGTIVGTRGGWAYKPTTGELWLNTNTGGVSENTW